MKETNEWAAFSPGEKNTHRLTGDLSQFESDVELLCYLSIRAMWQLCGAASDLLLSLHRNGRAYAAGRPTACLIARGERGPKHTSHGTQVHCICGTIRERKQVADQGGYVGLASEQSRASRGTKRFSGANFVMQTHNT